MSPEVSRRGLLGALGGSVAAAGLVAGGVATARAATAGGTGGAPGDRVVPFHGEHQAGIATPVQTNLHFASFDVTTTDRAELVALLQDWTTAAAQLCAGLPVGDGGALDGVPAAPPDDTGEALDLDASRLTLTLGLGASLFDDRFGLADRRPAALADLPAFPGDQLEEARSGGDLCVQACADDPQVAVHAIRNLNRIAAGRAAVRWAQLGFGRAATTDPDEPTPRNLFGFKDGTANPSARDAATLDEQVWVAPEDAGTAPGVDDAWMAGGSYLVARRIGMVIETWDRDSLDGQEQIVGRTKGEGAPLGGVHEHDPVDPSRLPASSHVALAHPSRHGGAQLLRRGYNYVEGSDGLGHLDAGLFFLAYQRDPRTQFVPIQAALARDDAMNEYLRHTGSGLWAVPAGVAEGGWWGQALLA